MKLESKAIAAAFEECFTESDSPIVTDREERICMIRELTTRLKNLKHVVFEKKKGGSRYYSTPCEEQYDPEISIELRLESFGNPYKYYSPNMEVTILFDSKNKLNIYVYDRFNSITWHSDTVIPANIPAFIENVNQRRPEITAIYEKRKQEQEKRKLKRAKIKGLKNSTIMATMREIAREEQLEFVAEEMREQLRFTVKLAEKERLDIDIPYKDFQNVLLQVRSAIKTIRELRKNGVVLWIKRYAYHTPKWQKIDE